MSGVLLVTGASRGIGAATALAGAARGYAVCVNYRSSAERAEALVERVRGGGGRAIAVAADMALEGEVVELFASVDRELGSLTALVNNAGIIGGACRVDEVTGAQLARLYAVNVIGPVLCAREAVLAKPVVTSNQALAWHALRLVGERRPVPGYGQLLAL